VQSDAAVINETHDPQEILEMLAAWREEMRDVVAEDFTSLSDPNGKAFIYYVGEKRSPEAILFFHWDDANTKHIRLEYVETRTKNKGYGKKLIQKLIDDFGKDHSIELEPLYSGFGMDWEDGQRALEKMYEGFGFKHDKTNLDGMYLYVRPADKALLDNDISAEQSVHQSRALQGGAKLLTRLSQEEIDLLLGHYREKSSRKTKINVAEQ
jgi:GNAT superfamily N-acetyltransferase